MDFLVSYDEPLRAACSSGYVLMTIGLAERYPCRIRLGVGVLLCYLPIGLQIQ